MGKFKGLVDDGLPDATVVAPKVCADCGYDPTADKRSTRCMIAVAPHKLVCDLCHEVRLQVRAKTKQNKPRREPKELRAILSQLGISPKEHQP